MPSTSGARPRHGPPATAHVAEDPLRASPAPLGDMGLPPSIGPLRSLTGLRTTIVAGDARLVHHADDRHVTRLAALCDLAALPPVRSPPPATGPASPPPATSPPSRRSPPCPRRRHGRSAFASPGARFARHPLPHHPLHSCPHHCGRHCRRLRQRASHACRQLLRTDRHSVAVAAPVRRVLRRPFPFAHTAGSAVPDRIRGLWFSHPTHPRCWWRHSHPWPPALCATPAFRRQTLVGPSVCRTDTRRPSCPWPCGATLVLHRYTGGTRFSLPKTPTDTRPAYAQWFASAPAAAFAPGPCTPPNTGAFADIPEREPYSACP